MPGESIGNLINRFREAQTEGRRRAAAEYAFVIAQRLRNDHRLEEASAYARKCIQILETLPSETLEDVISEHQAIGGIAMPDYFHAGTARARLEALLRP
ncbi:hypothetical protein OG555_18890 [Kribbella sp. NBC_01484]|uniref:hypothetical protein n=1 Tax=Kribbella sp. NBC_01484 TaxID=2903579 RepID=UPI002E370C3D|nr:hypothetical protein [Kribbella sp. NBC_01484]